MTVIEMIHTMFVTAFCMCMIAALATMFTEFYYDQKGESLPPEEVRRTFVSYLIYQFLVVVVFTV